MCVLGVVGRIRTLSVRTALSRYRHRTASIDASSIARAVDGERRSEKNLADFRSDLVDRYTLGFAPYGIGVAASLIGLPPYMMFTRLGDTGASPFAQATIGSLHATASVKAASYIWPAATRGRD